MVENACSRPPRSGRGRLGSSATRRDADALKMDDRLVRSFGHVVKGEVDRRCPGDSGRVVSARARVDSLLRGRGFGGAC